eukprot:3205641-Rhodomonas_salina.1
MFRRGHSTLKFRCRWRAGRCIGTTHEAENDGKLCRSPAAGRQAGMQPSPLSLFPSSLPLQLGPATPLLISSSITPLLISSSIPLLLCSSAPLILYSSDPSSSIRPRAECLSSSTQEQDAVFPVMLLPEEATLAVEHSWARIVR